MGPIEQLAHELMMRELAKPKPNRDWEAKAPSPKTNMSPIAPEIAALIGLGTDAFGTYKALKRPGVVEANPMLGMFHNDPLKTGLGVAATGLGSMLARNLVREKGGWMGKIADLMAGQAGADGISLGVQNLQNEGHTRPSIDPRNAFEQNRSEEHTSELQSL